MSSGIEAPKAPMWQKSVFRGGTLSLLVLALFSLKPQATALQQVQAKGELTMVGVSGPTTFVQQDGNVRGFQYELAHLFAEQLGVKLTVESARSPDAVINAVRHGDADMAITGLASDDPRLNRLRTGEPYLEVSQQLISRTDQPMPANFDSIHDARIAVAAGSSEAARLHELVKQRPDLHEVDVPQADAFALLDMVNDHKADYVVLNSNEFNARRALFPDLGVAVNLHDNAELAWAFARNGDLSLFNAAQQFLDKIDTDGTLDRLAAFYGQQGGTNFDESSVRAFQRDIAQRLPRYQKLFEKNAKTNDMDWHLLAAIAYQESKWQASAISPTGVQGIMMLTQSTAEYMDVANRTNPNESIRGGAAYYKEIADRLPATVHEPDRTWMALAAYNMGPGAIDRARQMTAAAGDDADKWLHVSRHLREMAADARRHGRPAPAVGQALAYVQEVRRYYDAMLLNSELQDSRVAMNTQNNGITRIR